MPETLPQALETFSLESLNNQTLDSLKKIYHKLAFSSHPDRGGSAKEFIKIRKAYSTLKDYLTNPNKRDQNFHEDNQEQESTVDYKSAYQKIRVVAQSYENIFNAQISSISSTTEKVNINIANYNQTRDNLNSWLEERQRDLKKQYNPPFWKEFLPGKKMSQQEYIFYSNEIVELYNTKMKELDDSFMELIIGGYKDGFKEIIELLNQY